jgi:hypothetical protein
MADEPLIQSLVDRVNRQEAEFAVLRTLLVLVARQASDRAALLREFDRSMEDQTVRTIYATMPEEFLEELRIAASVFREQLLDDG